MAKNIKKRDGRTFKLDSSVIVLAVATAGKENGTELDQATCTMNQGIVYRKTGRFHDAENAYEEALRIYRTTPGTELDQVICTANLGNVYLQTGRIEITIQFSKEQIESKMNEVVKAALGEAYKCVRDLIHRK